MIMLVGIENYLFIHIFVTEFIRKKRKKGD